MELLVSFKVLLMVLGPILLPVSIGLLFFAIAQLLSPAYYFEKEAPSKYQTIPKGRLWDLSFGSHSAFVPMLITVFKNLKTNEKGRNLFIVSSAILMGYFIVFIVL